MRPPPAQHRFTVIVIANPNSHQNTGERAFIAHIRSMDGIALVNFMVGGGGPRKPGREIDAIVILPRGIFSVEVKYTNAKGLLDSPLNDVWSIGDIAHPFSSRNKTPAAQADQATKILASHLTSPDWPKAYITPAVALHGPVDIPEQVRWVGTVGVCTVEHFGLLVKQAKGRRIQAAHIGPMLQRLGVSLANIPDLDTLLEVGFAAEADTEPEDAPTSPAPRPQPPASGAPDAPVTLEPASHADSTEDPSPQQSVRGVRARTAALMTLVALAVGFWQLSTARVFEWWMNPLDSESFFIYGQWSRVARDGVLHDPDRVALAGVAITMVLSAFVALWLRMKVIALSVFSTVAYALVVAGTVIFSPVIFRTTGLNGLIGMFALYAIGWPLVSMLAHDLSGPVKRYLDHLRRTYQF